MLLSYSKGYRNVFFLLSLSWCFFLTGQNDKPADATGLYNISLEELLNVGIVSASKKKQSIQDAPAMAYVVTELQIDRRGYTNLLDLLEDIPEVEVQRNVNAETRNLVSIRGVVGNEKILILQNGIRITPATGDNYTLGANFPLTYVRRVEVILGPASALYGVDAFSGIVNIITKSQDGTVVQGAGYSTSAGNFGTFNNNFSGVAKVDKVNVSLVGGYYASAEPSYNKFYPSDYVWYQNQYSKTGAVVESPFYQDVYDNVDYFKQAAGASFNGGALSRGFSLPTSSYYINAEINYDKFTVGYYRSSERHSSSYGIQSQYTTYAADAFVEQMQEVIYGRHAYTSFNKKWGLQTTFTQNFYELNPESNFQGSSSRWQRGYIYSNGQSSKLEEQFNIDFSKKISFITGGSFERLSALPRTGLSPKPYDKFEPAYTQDIYYIGAAGYTPYPDDLNDVQFDPDLTLLQNQYNLNYYNMGAYAQFQISPVKFIDITLGSRFDKNTRFGSSFNPRAGLVLTPMKKLKVKLLYGESFLAPSPKKAFEQNGAFFGQNNGNLFADYLRIANPDLKPEKLKSFDFSANYFITSNISFSANAFYTTVSNLINLNGSASLDQTPENVYATRLESSINQGTQLSYGGTAKLNALITLGKISLNNSLAFTYIDGQSQIDVDGDETLNEMPLLATAKNTFKGSVEFSYNRLSVTPRLLYKSQTYSNALNYDATYQINDAYMVLHLSARYLVKKGKHVDVSVFGNGRNITNALYYNVSIGNEESMALVPQEPMRLEAGLKFNFK
jgi:outer membrane receptor for ferrienterochelin and colicin